MSKILVQKFGGTSVGDPERIKRVAARIKSYHEKGYQLVVVVSAMGHTTDELVDLAAKISTNPPKREMDMLLSTGEQVSIALLAMALHETGVPARSFTGGQVNIVTDGNFSNARIESIDARRLTDELDKGQVCIVAGFQGVDQNQNITTLGRGGSDTTAVALAAALKAKECEIYTDVDGVYTTDPNKVEAARKLDQISYDEMLELASLGAGVLHSRSVEFAKKYDVVIHVKSSFNYNEGTKVVSENQIMEKLKVTGVTLKSDDARMTIGDIPDRPGVAAEIFEVLSEKRINIDVIVQSTGKDKLNTISFTLPVSSVRDAKAGLEPLIQKWGAGSISTDENIAILSAVGVGMKSHSGVAASMFKVLAEQNINIEMISTSEIKISCVISQDRGKEALRLIHTVFGLDKINMSLGGASMPIGSHEDARHVQREPGDSMPIGSHEDARRVQREPEASMPIGSHEDARRVQREPEASMPIGVFDSGLGGLTVLSEIHRVLPHENLVYFGDTARVPYGNKSSTTIIRYSREITKFLLRQNVKAIVVACNTASSYALEAIREMTEIPVLGVIDPAVRSLTALAPATAVAGLIATKGTIASRAYEASLGRHRGVQQLVTQPCPLLVPLIEEGYADSKAAELILRDYLQPMAERGVEYLLLGCTHYPLIATTIKKLYPQFRLIDSAAETATNLKSLLAEAKLLGDAQRPAVDLFVSDMTESMQKLKDLFFAGKVDRFEVAQISEET